MSHGGSDWYPADDTGYERPAPSGYPPSPRRLAPTTTVDPTTAAMHSRLRAKKPRVPGIPRNPPSSSHKEARWIRVVTSTTSSRKTTDQPAASLVTSPLPIRCGASAQLSSTPGFA